MTRALALVATLAACGGRDAATAPTRPARADADAAPPPATFAVVDGDWALEPVGGATTTPEGVAIVDDQVAVLLATIGGDTTLARRDRAVGSTWQLEVVAPGTAFRAVSAAQLAVRDGRPVMLLLEVDAEAMTVDIAYRERGQRELVAGDCSLVETMAASLIAAAPAPIVTYTCGGDRIVARRDAAGWKTLATLERSIVTGAADAAGDVVLVSVASRAPGRSWIVRGGGVTASVVPGVAHGGEVAACGGRLYGTFERTSEDGSVPAFGRWIDGAWQLETVTTELAGSGVLGFDEACHPFVALGDLVWSRGRQGWAKTSLRPGVSVQALVGHRGVLYASYAYHADGIRAGVASAPLRVD